MNLFKKTFAILLVFVLTFILGFLVSQIDTKDPFKMVWNEQIGTIKTDFSYGTSDKHKFDLYLPNKKQAYYGLVVYLHAGGFTTGDKAGDEKILKYFTSKGFVSAGINYSLASENNPATILQMSDEIKIAIPKVIEQAKALGYPIDKMAVMGGSAGGALAMIYAYRDGKTAPVPIKFVMYQVSPSSFEPSDWYGMGDNVEQGAGWVAMMTGTKPTATQMQNGEYKALLKPISGYAWVDKDSPPTLCAFGKLDKVVPFATTTRLFEALKTHNVPHHCYVFEHSGHALHRDKDKQQQFMASLDEYLQKYLQ